VGVQSVRRGAKSSTKETQSRETYSKPAAQTSKCNFALSVPSSFFAYCTNASMSSLNICARVLLPSRSWSPPHCSSAHPSQSTAKISDSLSSSLFEPEDDEGASLAMERGGPETTGTLVDVMAIRFER
jgi:hypothetical protein